MQKKATLTVCGIAADGANRCVIRYALNARGGSKNAPKKEFCQRLRAVEYHGSSKVALYANLPTSQRKTKDWEAEGFQPTDWLRRELKRWPDDRRSEAAHWIRQVMESTGAIDFFTSSAVVYQLAVTRRVSSMRVQRERKFKERRAPMAPWAAKTLKPLGWVDPEKRRPNSAARGYGSAWRKIHARVLEQHPVCVKCGEEPSDTVDHIITKARSGTDDESNLQALCRECHSRKTAVADHRWGK